jgi:apolipoprotein N-acyltransferase
MNLIIGNHFILKNKLKIVLTSIISWGIVAFGQPSWNVYCGALSASIGFALFWWGVDEIESRKIKFYFSMLWFMACEAIHLSWMTATIYQGSYIYFFYLFILAVFGTQFGGLSLMVTQKKDFTGLRILSIASIWILFEWSRLFLLSGFPFDPVGLSLASFDFSRQWASIGGIYFLSFWVILTNLVALRGLSLGVTLKKGPLFLTLAALPYFYGFAHIQYHSSRMKAEPKFIEALLVQTALSPVEKTGINGFDKMMPPLDQWGSIFSYLSPYRGYSIDLIVFPETTVPFSGQEKLYPLGYVRQFVSMFFGEEGLEVLKKMPADEERVDNLFISQFISNFFKAQVIVGLEYIKEIDAKDYITYASAYSLRPDEKIEKYHKRILLPIVEYLPFKWCEDLAKQYEINGWYKRGVKSKLFSGNLKISPSICIEELYGSLVRENRKSGANLFVNITNDVWFPNSKLPSQHFEHGRLRSIENGVPLLRACNTGVTVGIDSLGRIVKSFHEKEKTSQWKQGALLLSLPQYQYGTLYLFFGDAFILLLSTGCILLTLIEKNFSKLKVLSHVKIKF